ncbi:MAG TPA: serine hydrolase [Nitrolancea sp.]|nr:serine hydrolase [Nitrolancea sp.]
MSASDGWNYVAEVVDEVSRFGTIGVSLIGPAGETWEHWGERKFRAASTVKIGVMVEVYRQIDAGRLTLSDLYRMQESDRAQGSGVLRHLREGIELSLADLLYLMMSISDNVATNILIQMVGMEAVNRTMADLGMRNSNLSRLMAGRPAHADETENLGTPNDFARAMASILNQKAASPDSCAAMAELLTKQQNHRRLSRFLPRSESIRWGSKTGTSAGSVNDVGYIEGPNGRLIAALFAEQYVDVHTAESVIGRVARAAMLDTGVAGPSFASEIDF